MADNVLSPDGIEQEKKEIEETTAKLEPLNSQIRLSMSEKVHRDVEKIFCSTSSMVEVDTVRSPDCIKQEIDETEAKSEPLNSQIRSHKFEKGRRNIKKASCSTSSRMADNVLPDCIKQEIGETEAKLKPLHSQITSSKSEKGRRDIFKKRPMRAVHIKEMVPKKNPFRAPRPVLVPIASERVYYRGSYFTVGDVVSVVDPENRVFYAQIRGILQDQYCEKSAVITWLLPTTASPKGRFDPDTYIIGPEEDIPRKLDLFEFVCHAPNEFYKMKDPPHVQIPEKPVCGYVWTSKGPKIVPLPANDFSSDSE